MAYKWEKCYACGGSGIIVYEDEDADGEIIKCVQQCGRCEGCGMIKVYSDEDKY